MFKNHFFPLLMFNFFKKVIVNIVIKVAQIKETIDTAIIFTSSEFKSEQDYDQHSAAYDTLWLLETVKRISSGVVTRGNAYSNMLNVFAHFMNEV